MVEEYFAKYYLPSFQKDSSNGKEMDKVKELSLWKII